MADTDRFKDLTYYTIELYCTNCGSKCYYKIPKKTYVKEFRKNTPCNICDCVALSR